MTKLYSQKGQIHYKEVSISFFNSTKSKKVFQFPLKLTHQLGTFAV
jgi:hypothetical protein